MSRADKNSIDDLISSLGKGVVEEKLREAADPIESVTPRGPVDEDEAVADLLSHVPPDEGYYAKVYRRAPVPKEYGSRPLFLLDLENPDTIHDLESEVLRLAKANAWCDGLYEVKLFKKGAPGIQAVRRIALQVPLSPLPSPSSSSPSPDPFTQIQQTASLIKSLTSITPAPVPGTGVGSSEALAKALLEAWKAGADSARPTSSPTSDSLLVLAKALKELAPPPGPDLLPLLKEIGTPKPPPDPFDALIKLKQAGLLPSPSEAPREDPMAKALEMLTTLIPLVRSLGGGDGEPASAVTELIRVVGPQVGKVVEDITNTVNKVVEKGRPVPSPRPVPQVSLTPVPSDPPRLPIFAEVQKAAEASDVSFFPTLESLLERVTTPEQFEAIVAGTIPPESVLSQIGNLGGPFFSSPSALAYFQLFLSSLRSRREKEVVASCSKCSTEIVFDSLEEFQSDSICTECSSPLVLVSSSEPAKS